MRMIVMWLLSLCSSVAIAMSPAQQSRVEAQLQALGQAIDAWMDSAPADLDMEDDEQFEARLDAIAQSSDVEDEFFDYLAWHFCHQPAALSYALTTEWGDRMQRFARREVERSGDLEEARLLRLFGMRPTLLLAYVGLNFRSCPAQALAVLDHARNMPPGAQDGHAELNRLRHALTRLGVQFEMGTAKQPTREILQLLDQMLAVLRIEQLDDAEDVKPVLDYRDALRQVSLGTQTPRWTVYRSTGQAKVSRHLYDHYPLAVLFGEMGDAAMFPAWPNEVVLLLAEGQAEAAAAYALADLFEIRQAPNSSFQYDEAELVWQVYGKEATQSAIEAAAQNIEVLQIGDERLAILTLFGHEFALTSGRVDRGSEDTQWLEQAEIEAEFRRSSASLGLSGQN
jgi:hypothetical protein